MHDSSMTEEQLFIALGEEIAASSKMGMPLSDQQKETMGRRWFSGHLAEIRAKICGNQTIEDLATKSDTAALLAATAPLLGFSPTSAASATIALLIARIGIRRICAETWKD